MIIDQILGFISMGLIHEVVEDRLDRVVVIASSMVRRVPDDHVKLHDCISSVGYAPWTKAYA